VEQPRFRGAFPLSPTIFGQHAAMPNDDIRQRQGPEDLLTALGKVLAALFRQLFIGVRILKRLVSSLPYRLLGRLY
jgi:hypothetical protein